MMVRGLTLAAMVSALSAVMACKAKSNLTDEQAAARTSQGVEDVCAPRGSTDDVVLIDRIFAGTSNPSASSQSRAKNSWYMRVAFYDAATGARKTRVTVDKIRISRETSEPERVSCLGWSMDKLWLWSRRHGLHARDASGAMVHSQDDLVTAAQGLSVGIANVGFAPEHSKVLIETKDGRRWLLGEGLRIDKAPRRPKITKRRRSMGRNFRIQGGPRRGGLRAQLRGGKRLGAERDGSRITLSVEGAPIGSGLDFKHVIEVLRHHPSKSYEWDGPAVIVIEPGLDQKAPRTVHRVRFDGKVVWQIREPESCAAPFNCSTAAWQATTDGKRLYFYGKTAFYAYDAATGKQLWRAAY